jgi:hypothetical protein
MEDQKIPSCFHEPILGQTLHTEKSTRSQSVKPAGFSRRGIEFQGELSYRKENRVKAEHVKLMKALLVFLLGLTLAVAVNAKTFEMVKKAGENTVTVTLEKDSPATGDNNITVAVKDPAGKAVTDVKVAIEYFMPAMMGMPAMNYKATPELKGDKYTGKLNFSMAGAWNVNVKVTRGGKSETIKRNVDVR